LRPRRLLPAIDRPDTARLMLEGTGLAHLGSASGCDAMHKAAAECGQTGSMRIFLEGVESGKPAHGETGAPECFYKGYGQSLVGPGKPLTAPAFAPTAARSWSLLAST
jgi:hypothetical protein